MSSPRTTPGRPVAGHAGRGNAGHVAMLAGPTAYAVDTMDTPYNGGDPAAGRPSHGPFSRLCPALLAAERRRGGRGPGDGDLPVAERSSRIIREPEPGGMNQAELRISRGQPWQRAVDRRRERLEPGRAHPARHRPAGHGHGRLQRLRPDAHARRSSSSTSTTVRFVSCSRRVHGFGSFGLGLGQAPASAAGCATTATWSMVDGGSSARPVRLRGSGLSPILAPARPRADSPRHGRRLGTGAPAALSLSRRRARCGFSHSGSGSGTSGQPAASSSSCGTSSPSRSTSDRPAAGTRWPWRRSAPRPSESRGGAGRDPSRRRRRRRIRQGRPPLARASTVVPAPLGANACGPPRGCAPAARSTARPCARSRRRPGRAAPRALIDRARPTDDDDRRVRFGADDADDLCAVEPRHGQIEQHDIDRLGAEAAQRLVAVVGRDDPVAGLAQHGAQRADPGRLVIDNEQRQ